MVGQMIVLGDAMWTKGWFSRAFLPIFMVKTDLKLLKMPFNTEGGVLSSWTQIMLLPLDDVVKALRKNGAQ